RGGYRRRVPQADGSAARIKVGCSGWNYQHWRNGVFYPPRCAARNWLRFYAQHFDTVEINMTFYRLPKREAVARWAEETPHGFQVRHESWFTPEVMESLRERNVALVIGDRPQVHGFQTLELTADFTFVRFHGGTRGRNGNYSHAELDEWTERLRAWSREVDVFAYFNNDWEGFAIENALYLKKGLGSPVQVASSAGNSIGRG